MKLLSGKKHCQMQQEESLLVMSLRCFVPFAYLLLSRNPDGTCYQETGLKFQK